MSEEHEVVVIARGGPQALEPLVVVLREAGIASSLVRPPDGGG